MTETWKVDQTHLAGCRACDDAAKAALERAKATNAPAWHSEHGNCSARAVRISAQHRCGPERCDICDGLGLTY